MHPRTCNGTPGGGCTFCGAGQCCRRFDAERCVAGCELAGSIGPVPAPQSQCGNFWVHDDAAIDALSCVPATLSAGLVTSTGPAGPASSGSASDASNIGNVSGLLRAGVNCRTRCGIYGGDCPSWCGAGQCCTRIDWYRGVPGCELAENITTAVCGEWSRPHLEPAEFRLPRPLGTHATPLNPPTRTPESNVSGWDGQTLRNINATGATRQLTQPTRSAAFSVQRSDAVHPVRGGYFLVPTSAHVAWMVAEGHSRSIRNL
jgi:hypothetical protein